MAAPVLIPEGLVTAGLDSVALALGVDDKVAVVGDGAGLRQLAEEVEDVSGGNGGQLLLYGVAGRASGAKALADVVAKGPGRLTLLTLGETGTIRVFGDQLVVVGVAVGHGHKALLVLLLGSLEGSTDVH
ncbi:hypothetical protein PG997_007461 [Apiospora hydei]|uniref:Roadblock/LAMTOR2 domain-containing protein n=1 Tax=Apiospora hydei TaxID=1337664 RepID=A0ABR1W835_9PEZI